MTRSDGLKSGESMMCMLRSVFHTDDRSGVAHSYQAGRRRQGVLGGSDRIGVEPRLVIDFNRGQPLVSALGRQVGERRGNTVRLHGLEYRIRRRKFHRKLQFEVRSGGRVVLRAKEVSQPGRTVRTLVTSSAPDLDPVVTLTLLLLEGRPDKMGFLNELLGNG